MNYPRLYALVLLFGLLAHTPAQAANVVDPSQIPDGTYTVKVEHVVDAKHIVVTLDNGSQATLAAGRSTVDFSKVKEMDQLKLSLIKGNVMVYADLTSH